MAGLIATSDFVGGIDPVDLYKFTVSSVTGLTINLTGLSADADLELYRDLNGDGRLGPDELRASSTLSGTSDETIALAGLVPGDYYVRVARYEGDTNYNLSMTPQTATGANLAVTRTDSTLPADLGSQFTYSARVTNNGPDTATNVNLSETLPSGLVLVGVTKSVPAGSIGNTSSGFVGTILSLAAGASVTFDVTVTSFIAGKLPTTTTVTSDTPDFDLANNNLSDSKAVRAITSPPADLELTQGVSTPNPNVGDQIIITLNLANKGPGTATDVKVRDVLPAGLTYMSSSADLGSYDAPTGTWVVGNMLPNVTYRLRITATVAAARTLTNTAQVTAVAESDPDSAPDNNRPAEDDQTSVTIIPVGATADLVLTQAVSDPKPQAGGHVTATLTLTNSGPGTATGIQVYDLLPVGLTYVSSSADQGSYDPGTGVWTVSNVTPGTSVQLRVTAAVAGGVTGTLTNTAEVVAVDQADPDSAPNNHQPAEDDQASATVGPVRATADLALTQAVSNRNPHVGDQITVTLTLTNKGPGTATAIRARDALPAGLTYASSSADLGRYDPGTGLWTVGNLPPGASARLRISAKVVSARTLTNTDEVVAVDQADPDSAPNNHQPAEDDQASATVVPAIPHQVPLTITKVQRFGIHAQPTTLVLTFSTQLDPVSVRKLANYRILGPGGRSIPVRSVVYNPTTNTVVVSPAFQLNIHYSYALIVIASAPGGLRTPSGSLLNGGRNYVSPIDRSNLVLPPAPKVVESTPTQQSGANLVKHPNGLITRIFLR